MKAPRITAKTKPTSVQGHKVYLQYGDWQSSTAEFKETPRKRADSILVTDGQTMRPLAVVYRYSSGGSIVALDDRDAGNFSALEFRDGRLGNVFVERDTLDELLVLLVDRVYARRREEANQIRFGRQVK